ncbi:MAG: glycogen debranching enzyme N-terminal domain-containing protein [Candidatus Obscuribacterales bacterium]|nr:glycogen debranching enzyme N-terminal domain-containing protein [Candidatus Obscuribacterales bacterium]
MTFGLINWLKARYPNLKYEVPIWYPSKDKVDGREWLVTNGLGGYSMGTVSGANRRRYHSVLVSSMPPPHNRHIILNRVEEVVSIDGREFELSTNHWVSGVVSPTGYKFIDSFTPLPVPTWVFEVEGSYLIRQLVHPWGTDEVLLGYHWLPDPDRALVDVRILCKFLVGFRSFHGEVKGSSDKKYSQFVSPN